MLRYIRLIFIALTALVLLFLALANRAPVVVRLLPEEMGAMLGRGQGWTMPLFLVIFLAIALGVLIGFVWEWLREMRIRGEAKTTARKLGQLEREIAVLKDSHSVPPQDEVLAILEDGDRRP
ncbi:LapA family protein [Pseudogemmobacter sonorensis]|uniref:LapA family protein n=1 Tax=Pseudogemmobacter sonorensis TaxID=2989681 RepID=UPI0036A9E0EA